MQKVQVLLQPTLIETQAAYAESRRVGRLDGKVSRASLISTWASPAIRARSSSTGSDPMLCVPKTTSTQGARFRIVSLSFWARQPPTAICIPGVAFLVGSRLPRLPYSLLSAFSRTAQVLNTTTSGVAPSGPLIPRGLQQPGQPLGVVHVHLAAVGADLVGTRHSSPRLVALIATKLKSNSVSIPPTGEQYEIVSGDHRAVITEVGATLRSYAVEGRDVVRGFAEHEVIKGGRGQNLLPWPNRIRDGQYSFAGQTQQLALSEPARHNAIHGLARTVPWVLAERRRTR